MNFLKRSIFAYRRSGFLIRSNHWFPENYQIERKIFKQYQLLRRCLRGGLSGMASKRPVPDDAFASPTKRVKESNKISPVPRSSSTDGKSYPNWPAPRRSIEAARDFILACSKSPNPVLLVPDRDCDGLSSGHIARQTLIALGKPKEKIGVHFLGKGRNIHSQEERSRIEGNQIAGEAVGDIIVLDQGSNDANPIAKGIPTLIIDHHYSKVFPEGATICSACESPPVATSSMLTYTICEGLLRSSDVDLSKDLEHKLAWLALIGICGDLGPGVPLGEPPYPPELNQVNTMYKTAISKLVAFLNAPRRTPTADPGDAWELLRIAADANQPVDPKQIMALTSDKPPKDSTLLELRRFLLNLDKARNATSAETERCSHTPPIFSEDGRIAILMIKSEFQIHPLIATRWAGHLKSKKLVAVGCANSGYLPGKVNFSCRLAKTSIKARQTETEKRTGKRKKAPEEKFKGNVDESETDEEEKDGENIISLLRGYAAMDDMFSVRLAEAEGREEVSFARGHKEASGGILTQELWDLFARDCLKLLQRDSAASKPANSKKDKAEAVAKKNGNTLDKYFLSPQKKVKG